MARYWNDKDVLQKLGEAMGFAVGEGGASGVDASAEEEEEGNDEESIVHQTASVGDVEVSVSYDASKTCGYCLTNIL